MNMNMNVNEMGCFRRDGIVCFGYLLCVGLMGMSLG